MEQRYSAKSISTLSIPQDMSEKGYPAEGSCHIFTDSLTTEAACLNTSYDSSQIYIILVH